MKALILTCNTGEGHNSVAAAVQEAFEEHGAACQTIDALSLLSEKASELICRWHTRIYRHMPGAWKVSYKLLEQHPANREEFNLVSRLLATGAERLYELVLAEGFDMLVCPHVFSALMVTRIRQQHPELAVSASFIATDYTCSPFAASCMMDCFFVPSPGAADEFTAADIPAERVVVTDGVPVRRAFYQRTDWTEARRQLGLRPTGKLVLAMCGSMGCGHLDELTELLADRMSAEDTLVVVCGTNAHLQKRLEKAYAGRASVQVWGYRDDMPLLMDCADLFLTKPGGVSTSEAAVKGLPMVLVDAVAACEEPNLRHFCATGGAVTADAPEDLAALCLHLLDDDGALERMRASLKRRRNAAGQVWSHLAEKEAVRR